MPAYYPTLSAVQLGTSYTGSQSFNNYLNALNNYVTLLETKAEAAPVYLTREFSVPAGVPVTTIACTVRNPYEIFFTRWLYSQKYNTPPLFADYVNMWKTGAWATPLSATSLGAPWHQKGCWYINNLKTNPSDTWPGVSLGQVTDQCVYANIPLNNLTVVHLESFATDVATLTTKIGLDVTNVNVARALTQHINNDAYNLNLSSINWKGQYTQDLADAVYNAYTADFAAFGYDKDSWKS